MNNLKEFWLDNKEYYLSQLRWIYFEIQLYFKRLWYAIVGKDYDETEYWHLDYIMLKQIKKFLELDETFWVGLEKDRAEFLKTLNEYLTFDSYKFEKENFYKSTLSKADYEIKFKENLINNEIECQEIMEKLKKYISKHFFRLWF